MKKPSTIVILPFRKGSKGIPDKNIKEIAGKPLFEYTLEAVMGVSYDLVSEIVIATDYPENMFSKYMNKDYRITFWNRNGTLGISDCATTELAIKELSDSANFNPLDTLVLIQITNPLLETKHLESALRKYRGEGTLFSVVPFGRYLWTENKKLVHFPGRNRRQDQEELYLENGSFYIFNYSDFNLSGDRMNDPIDFFIMPKKSLIELDDTEDLEIMKALLKES
jgi:CMP-N-acetylneuraminic acid synthetase